MAKLQTNINYVIWDLMELGCGCSCNSCCFKAGCRAISARAGRARAACRCRPQPPPPPPPQSAPSLSSHHWKGRTSMGASSSVAKLNGQLEQGRVGMAESMCKGSVELWQLGRSWARARAELSSSSILISLQCTDVNRKVQGEICSLNIYFC